MKTPLKTALNLNLNNKVIQTYCLYKTGKCLNPRALKRDQSRHKLCDYHRERANNSQRKLDQRKKHNQMNAFNIKKCTKERNNISACINKMDKIPLLEEAIFPFTDLEFEYLTHALNDSYDLPVLSSSDNETNLFEDINLNELDWKSL